MRSAVKAALHTGTSSVIQQKLYIEMRPSIRKLFQKIVLFSKQNQWTRW